jgi:alkylation response protein AidB-like acyl-CoA dehydrogenase
MSLALLEGVRALTSEIRTLAVRIERERAVPESLVVRLAELGVFRIAAPAADGGLEASPGEILEIFEELGYADGSTGWCAMIAGATSMALGHLDAATAGRLLADPRFLIAGVAAPSGRAVAVPGGYRVTGRWSFASASRQATWLVGGCVIPADRRMRLMIMEPGALTIHDTWDVAGLRGTGSHDIEAAEVFVPEELTFSLGEPPTRPGPLYAFPPLSLLAFGIGAVALGIARAAIEEFAGLAGRKRNPVSGESLAGKPGARAAMAEAEALRASGLAYLTTELDRAWPGPADRARLRLAITTATRNAAAAVDLVYRAGGGTSVYATSPLQRAFRDVHVATQHAMVSDDTLEAAGAALLGQESTTVRL